MGEPVDMEELKRAMQGKLISHPADTFFWRIPQHTEHTKQVPPLVVLALIARIRELETALLSAADIDDHGAMISTDATDLRALVAKGTVLP